MTSDIEIAPFETRFVPDIIRCLRETYGDDYFRRECYDPEYLVQSERDGSLRLLLATADENQFAGIIGIRRNPYFEGSREMAMQVIRPEFRGMGIGKRLLEQAIAQARNEGAVSVYGRSVTFHLISQNEMQLFGMRGTGFWFGRHKSKQTLLQSLPQPPAARKLHSLIMAGACADIPPLDLYPPEALRPAIRSVYGSLGIAVRFPGPRPPTEASRTTLFRLDDDDADNRDLYVLQAGTDFPRRLRRETASYHIRPLQTYNALVNMRDPACGFACRILDREGFFPTGLHPLNRNAEYLIFHRLPDPDIRFDELVLSPANQPLAELVKEEYQKKELNSFEEKKKYPL